jgi:NADPH:quinone reductase-like Zn-dependent oxidoreductase
MTAAPVNPSDLMYVAGRYGLRPEPPATPGFEGVGVVERGGGVLGWWRKGQRVAVLNDRRGTWAEWTVAPARRVIPVPADVPDHSAASFFVNPATAVVLTREVLAVPPGAWLLQTAAGGALGRMVIRLGKKHGFRTLNVVRRAEQVAELKAIGADAVLVEGDGDLPERVRAATGGAGARFAIDPVGGELAGQVLRGLAPGGRLVLYGSLADQPVPLDPRQLLTGGQRVEGFWLATWMQRQRLPKILRLVRGVRSLVREGVLATDPGTAYPLDRVREAVAEAARPGKPGKVLLTM